jgi:hypothetical protein
MEFESAFSLNQCAANSNPLGQARHAFGDVIVVSRLDGSDEILQSSPGTIMDIEAVVLKDSCSSYETALHELQELESKCLSIADLVKRNVATYWINRPIISF